MISNKQKKILFEKINSLCKTEHEEIYKIIREHDKTVSFSQNRNGVFFNLSDIQEELYIKLEHFVEFCITNKTELDAYDKRINECKINNNYHNIIASSELKSENEQGEKVEDWNAIINEPKSVHRVSNFIEKLMNDREKVNKKKVNTKFNNAKKKYSKKSVLDKKIEHENYSQLEPDEYVINT